MPILECEKCHKPFLIPEEEIAPIIGGKSESQRINRGLIFHIDKSCPFCGHAQGKESLLMPL